MSEPNSLEPYSLDLAAGLPKMATAPTTPRQQLRYARILKTAAGFAQRQFDTVSLSDVSTRAHVPLGTLYRYFPSTVHLMLAVFRQQLRELNEAAKPASSRCSQQEITGLAMEIFHMRVMQPAVEHCLSRTWDTRDGDIPVLLRDIEKLSAEMVGAAIGDAGRGRILLHVVSGLVQSVNCRRLSLFDAEKDLKNACKLFAVA
ncbi:TetR/AcrR family transcriptional regulator [bacterium RCC_150]